jgi:outer membrane lipopolysaccharide assembly protein LptE/RlpB
MMRVMATFLAAISLAGCGYHVGGRADLLPSTLHTIAIPAFANASPRYRLTGQLPAAITREFLTRTRYRVVADPNEADAVLYGTVRNYFSFPTIFDQRTGRAAGVQVHVFLDVKLVERATGKVLFERQNYEFRGRYEIATDQAQYFDESSTALERLSREVARQLVSSILEAF